jgi:hypothetical protein
MQNSQIARAKLSPQRRFLYIALHSRILHCVRGRLGRLGRFLRRLGHFRGVGFAFGIPKYPIYYVPISYIFLPSARLASSSALGFTSSSAGNFLLPCNSAALLLLSSSAISSRSRSAPNSGSFGRPVPSSAVDGCESPSLAPRSLRHMNHPIRATMIKPPIVAPTPIPAAPPVDSPCGGVFVEPGVSEDETV